MKPDEFKRQLVELRTVICDGVAYFSAWRGLMVEHGESAQALNRYRGLFLPARNALLWMAIMQFAKVFDRDPRTVSLRNLLVKAKADPEQLIPNAGEEELKQIGTQIDTNEAVLERLKGLRDQRIAHHDAHPAKELSLLHGDLTRLVEEIKSMYNSLERGHNRESTFFENLTHDAERHTSEVVRIMREDRDRAIRRVNETNTAQSI